MYKKYVHYKTLLEKIKDLDKWRHTLLFKVQKAHWCDVNLPRQMYRFTIILIKITQVFCRNWQMDSEIYLKIQKN